MRDWVDPLDRDAVVIKVIKTELLTIGEGTQDSPIRRITRYYSLDGSLLAACDPFKDPIVAKLTDKELSILANKE